MDTLYDSLQRAQAHLRRAGIDSAAIGGLAVNVWGRARVTNDVDLKVALDRERASELLDIIAPDFTPITGDPLSRLQQVGFVFTRDSYGNRIDFLLADIGFDDEAIRRATDVEVRPDVVVRLCTPEDLIVYKLISTRQRDLEDARTVVVRQSSHLDNDYITKWLREFELALDDSTLVQTFQEFRRRAT